LNLADEDLELDAELVCCELVTNAVEHAGGAGTVRVDVTSEVRSGWRSTTATRRAS
jgi:anti-sigma regulatory factor (Ser/Thr protein kinase)